MIHGTITLWGPLPGKSQPQPLFVPFPRLPGESFEDALARLAPIIRDALQIPPAPDMDEWAWRGLVKRVTQGAK